MNLMENHELMTETVTSEENSVQVGGSKDKPFGGFPPIFICSKDNEPTKATKTKEYVKPTKTVSIADIIKKKKKVEPFINLL